MGMAKQDRLLYILNLLRSRRNLNASRLAEECGVAERTIYRDIISISEANIPIYYDKGYKYASDNFLPPLNFNLEEYLTLNLALESSPLYQSGIHKRLIKGLKLKIDAVLSESVRREKSQAVQPTAVNIRATVSDRTRERYYGIVEESIRRHAVLRVTYFSIESGVSVREIEPYFMIFIERAFYFVGYCRLRKSLRTFRMDRIRDIVMCDEKFVPREDIDPMGYFKDSWGVFSGEKEEVEIIFTGKAARVVLTGKHHNNEIITQLDESTVKYNVTVSGIEEISGWLMRFGGEARVVKPDKLAEAVRRKAEEIAAVYKR